MLLLTATTHKVRLVTGQAVTVDVHASYADYAAGTVTLGSNNVLISTATTTDIVGVPGASTTRKVKLITARNRHASTPVDVTVIIDISATVYELAKTTLQPGQTLQYVEDAGFFVFEPLAANARSRQILTTSGTYTTPAGVRAILIEAVGGGGAGGGVATAVTNAGAGGGGGGGAYSSTLVQTPAATYSYTIGAAGAAGAAGANAGGNGGDSIFGSVCTAKGGTGGGADTVAAGPRYAGSGSAGGIISTGVGDLKLEGESGADGTALAAAQAVSGAGGRSIWAPGAQQKKNVQGAGGAPLHTNGGGGGSGGVILSGGASVAGGAGGAGLIVVIEMA